MIGDRWRTRPGKDTTEYIVQLQRHEPDDDSPDGYTVAAKWSAIRVVGSVEADQVRTRLYRDNKWGSLDGWPYVDIRLAGTSPEDRA